MSEKEKIVVCPYCGHVQAAGDRCGECRGLFEPLSRRATQISMGPWFVRDKLNPFRPGCSYEVLKKQIASGRVKAMSVIRGPTTHQFWAVARNVPGVANLLGYCHKCSNHVSPEDRFCPTCNESFREPIQRDELGLIYPTATEASAAQRALERELSLVTGTVSEGAPPQADENKPGVSAAAVPGVTSAGWLPARQSTAGGPPALPAMVKGGGGASGRTGAGGGDLLDEVLGKVAAKPPAVAQRKPSAARPQPAAKPVARPVVAQAVDFAPSEEGQLDAPAARPGMSWVMWAMIGINVLILIALILFVATVMGQ